MPFYLVAKRIYRLTIDVQELHELQARAPHWVRTTEIYAPCVAVKVQVILMCVDATVIVKVLHHEALAGARRARGRGKNDLTSREFTYSIYAIRVSYIIGAIVGC